MRITEYDKTPTLAKTDTFLLETHEGTKGMLALDLAKGIIEMANNGIEITNDSLYRFIDSAISIETRNDLWRGKNLGDHVTDEQWEAISTGTFKDLFIGDYWEINSRKWRIMDFNYWIGTGDVVCNTNHVVIMPDYVLYNNAMNLENTSNGAYVNTDMRKSFLNTAKVLIKREFGENHILSHREYLQNAATTGYAIAGAWFNSDVEIPNEPMIYGAYFRTPAGNGQRQVDRASNSSKQLSALRLNPHLYKLGETVWLRDVTDAYRFTAANIYGQPSVPQANQNNGVRPVFGIK